MIKTPNLPFQQDYFSNSQNLQILRSGINNLISKDIQTMQSLLSIVQNVLNSPYVFNNSETSSETYKKQKELELFKYLSEQNRDRSDKVNGLAQLVIKLIDFIQDQHQNNQTLIYSYQRKIEQLTESINQTAYNKSLVEKDIQILKQQLQCAQIEIDKLIEERTFFNENQLVNNELKEQLHNFKIQLLQNQLNKLKNTLSFFNNQQKQHKTSFNFFQQSNTLKYTYSLDHFKFPKTFKLATQLANEKSLKKDISSSKVSKNEYAFKINRSPKKTVRYLTENNQSQENIDDDQIKNSRQTKKKLEDYQKSSQKGNCFKKDSSIEFKELQINSNSEQTENMHRLCSDFSQKSFFYQILPQIQQLKTTRLIYITENEDQIKSSSLEQKLEFHFNNLTTCIQTKESDISTNNVAKPNHNEIKPEKKFKPNMSKNTITQTKILNTINSPFINNQTEKVKQQQSKGIYQYFANFIVKNRVKRTCQKANSGICKFL